MSVLEKDFEPETVDVKIHGYLVVINAENRNHTLHRVDLS
jgi:hypothetical protein